MGAVNFAQRNVLYPVDTCEADGEDEDFASDRVRWLVYSIRQKIEEKNRAYEFVETDEQIDDRHYSGRIFWELSYKGVELKLLYTWGYYSGANFDYEITARDKDGYEMDDGCLTKTQEKIAARMGNLVKKCYWAFIGEHRRLGVFSNGEAIYEAVKK